MGCRWFGGFEGFRGFLGLCFLGSGFFGHMGAQGV